MKTITFQIAVKRNTYKPGDGTRVFAVQFQWPDANPEWLTIGATDENDANEYVATLNETISGSRPSITRTVELFYDTESRQYQPEQAKVNAIEQAKQRIIGYPNPNSVLVKSVVMPILLAEFPQDIAEQHYQTIVQLAYDKKYPRKRRRKPARNRGLE